MQNINIEKKRMLNQIDTFDHSPKDTDHFLCILRVKVRRTFTFSSAKRHFNWPSRQQKHFGESAFGEDGTTPIYAHKWMRTENGTRLLRHRTPHS